MMEDESSNVGYRFHPKDYELVDHFLKNKMRGKDSLVSRIGELNITDFEPWELPGQSVVKSKDQEWYFFCPRKPKYLTGRRCQRNTKKGQWKITGKERKVKMLGTKEVIGSKRTLVFYQGKAGSGNAPRRTSWVMHEYSSIDINDPTLKPYVLCLVKKKQDENDIPTQAEPETGGYEAEPSHNPVDSATLLINGDESTIPELYEHQEPDIESLFDHQPQELDFSHLPLLMQDRTPNMEWMQLQSGITDQEDDLDFLNNLMIQPVSDQEDDVNFLNNLMIQPVSDDSSPAESLMREYEDHNLFSCDTDAEVFDPRYQRIMEDLSNELESKHMRKQTTLTARGCAPDSVESYEEGQIRENTVSRYQCKGRSASSAADHYHSIVKEEEQSIARELFSLSLVPEGVASANRSTLSAKKGRFCGKETAAESSNATHVLKKGLLNVKLDIESKIHRETEKKKSHRETEKKKSKSNGRGSFIIMETPLLVHKASSPSVCFFNALVGAILSIVMVLELLSMGGC